ncbi:alkaline shock response membrane anchor protein AmaP [Actinoallomurus acaciae]|uniref:Alkaline shock response membrane anchor protein AmaP n=1 Tax=Actinoallomurus acaciae TaxID=502577 RepID=A0ABV5YPE4_9ACTN
MGTRANRLGLALTGLILLLGGLTAAVRGAAFVPHHLGAAHVPVIGRFVRAFADAHLWFWIALAALAVAIGILALSWLGAQGRRPVLRTIRLEPDTRYGATTLSARAVADALEDDLSADPYVRRATAGLTGSRSRPHLLLNVTVDPDADPAAARSSIHEAVERARHALEHDDQPATVRIRVGR